ncbi:MAG: DUF4177 domain-containing protein [Gemmatales bacterium]|nr:DUF4177 domain-containing protein [Gemmatales bacterium]
MGANFLWRRGLLVLGSVALVAALGGWAAGLAQNDREPQPVPAGPVPAQPVQVQRIQIQPVPVPPQPAKPVQPGDVAPGGGGAQPVPPQIRVAPEPLQWEYRVVEFIGRDTEEHTKLLNQLAAEGWEYVGLVNLYVTQTNGTTNGQPSGLVAFRRPKGGPIQIRPVPLRPPVRPPAQPIPDKQLER